MQTAEETHMPVKVSALSVDDTQYFNIAPEDRPLIRGIHTVYAFDREARTYCCEITPSRELRYLYTYVDVVPDAPEDVRSALDEKYCYCGGEDTYMWISSVDRLNPKDCGEFDTFEEACEYLQGNCPF